MTISKKLKQFSFIGLGAGLGALVMYLLDPHSGRRRRGLLRDKAMHALALTRREIPRLAYDISHRLKGSYLEAKSRIQKDWVPDEVLVDRVRARLGHIVSRPGDIEVTAQGGTVCLTGVLGELEARRVIREIGRVRGVEKVTTLPWSHRKYLN